MENYDFIKACDMVCARISKGSSKSKNSGKPVAVLITPWLQTAVPFFSLEIAMFLKQKGHEITVLLDCTNLEVNSTPWFGEETAALQRLCKRLDPYFPHIDVEQFAPGTSHIPENWIDWNYRENAVRKEKGEIAGAHYMDSRAGMIQQAVEHSKKIHAVLEKIQPAWVLIPGGFFGLTGLYSETCRHFDIPFTTYDAGQGDLRISHNGIAAQNEYIPELFHKVRKDQRLLAEMWDKTKAIIGWRKEGNDPLQLQPKDCAPFTEKGHLVICLNYRADTAAMMRQLSFSSVTAWIEATAKWAVANKAVLYVRQHPCEKIERYRSSDDFGGLLRSIDPDGTFLRFISCHDDINTYDLIADACVVLPYSSRVGIEAAVLGKPVILHSKSFYRNLGFTFDAGSPEEYFAFLKQSVASTLSVSEEMRQSAAVCYSLLSDYSRIPNQFTPVPVDFMVWSAISHRELWQQAEMKSLANSLLSRRPYALCHYPELGQEQSETFASISNNQQPEPKGWFKRLLTK